MVKLLALNCTYTHKHIYNIDTNNVCVCACNLKVKSLNIKYEEIYIKYADTHMLTFLYDTFVLL